jgi:uroporphyrinogen-III synthase
MTGVGVQTIVEGARHAGCEDNFVAGLRRKRIAVRGPKTLNAIRRLGLSVDLIAPDPFTSSSLLEEVRREWSVAGESVLVQLYGAPVPAFRHGLELLGACVVEVSPYRWERPVDEEAVVRLIEDLAVGWIDVLAATSAVQVDHLFDIARDAGRELDLRRALSLPRLRVAAQGIVCASAFARQGVEVHVVPPRASMGAMVLEIAHSLEPPVTQAPSADAEVVALYVCRGVKPSTLKRVVEELPDSATVALLAGQSGTAERAAIKRGVAVHIIAPDATGHPADGLVRRADRVLIVSGGSGLGGVLQLAQRYAKPASVIGVSDATETPRAFRS